MITLTCLLLWFVLMSDYPEKDKFIEEGELDFILQSRLFNAQQQEQDKAVPVLPLMMDMLTNLPMWVIIVTSFGLYAGYALIAIEGPDFISKILPLGKEISSNGLYLALPFLLIAIIGPAVAIVAEYAVSHSFLSLLNSQRLCVIIGSLVPSAGMIAMTYLTSERYQYYCIALLSISFGFYGATYSGTYPNIMIMAPNRSGTVNGIVNTAGFVSQFFLPLIKAWVVQDDSNIADWRNLFILIGGTLTLAAILFSLCATSKIQDFNFRNYGEISVKASCCGLIQSIKREKRIIK